MITALSTEPRRPALSCGFLSCFLMSGICCFNRGIVMANSKSIETQVVVIGSGPGGYTAAFRAADLGSQVLLIEQEEQLGGVCLNVGCIPSKALLHAARVIEETREMAAHGLQFGEPRIDLEKLR